MSENRKLVLSDTKYCADHLIINFPICGAVLMTQSGKFGSIS